jgi:hypothetical protein
MPSSSTSLARLHARLEGVVVVHEHVIRLVIVLAATVGLVCGDVPLCSHKRAFTGGSKPLECNLGVGRLRQG